MQLCRPLLAATRSAEQWRQATEAEEAEEAHQSRIRSGSGWWADHLRLKHIEQRLDG